MAWTDRVGLGGLIVALFSLAIAILWPDKKWIGWASLGFAIILAAIWVSLELKASSTTLFKSYPVLSTIAVFVVGGIIASTAWLWLMRSVTQTPTVPFRQAAVKEQSPSFVFVFGVPLGDNDSPNWKMMLVHYGPNLAYNCTIEFFDDDRKNI